LFARHTIVRIIFLLFAVLGSFQSYAQGRRFLHLTTADGLPQNSVECFAQDSAGFLWIGTQDGLVRYDGYEMKVFRSNPEDSTSLSDNFITALSIDHEGDLWVGTRNGLNYYDREKNGFIKFYHQADALHQTVRNIYPVGDSVYALVRSRVRSLSKLSEWKWVNEFHTEPLHSSFSSRHIVALGFSEGSNFLELSSDSLYWNNEQGRHPIPLSGRWEGIKLSNYEILQGRDKWWVLSGGLFSFDPESQELELHRFPGCDTIAYTNSLALIDGTLWLGTDVGLFLMNEAYPDSVKEHYAQNPDDPYSLNYHFVHGIFKDREGRIWVGNANRGLNIHDPNWQNLRYLVHRKEANELPDALVWCAFKRRNGDLWVGTAGGVVTFPAFNPIDSRLPEGQTPEKLRDLGPVRDVLEGRDGRMWMATSRDGLVTYDPRTETREEWAGLLEDIVSVAEDAQGGIWAATYAGLFYKASDADAFERKDREWGTSSYCMSVAALGDEVIVCHSQGVHRFSISGPGPSVSSVVESIPGDRSTLPFSICSSAIPLGDKLYVGMYDRGLAEVDANMNVLRTLDESTGLSGHVIEEVAKDHRDRLWIATNQGLSLYNLKEASILNIDASSGLRNQEFTMHSSFQDEDGWMYFGTVDGLLFFHPDSIHGQRSFHLPQIALTDLRVNYEDYRSSKATFRDQPLEEIRSLRLSPAERVLSLRFSALNFANASDIRYFYQMSGFDQEWVEVATDQRLASYSSLPPGDYTFRTKATYPDGSLAAKPLEIPIVVLPPFYETWWFRLVALLTLFVAVAGVARFVARRRYRKQLQELETRERIQLERERISRDLHDNVGSQITYMISSLDNLSYQTSRAGVQKASDEINELGEFARGTMQQLREAIWVINKSEVSIEEFRLKLEEYCRKHLDVANGPAWKINISGDRQHLLPPGAALHLFRICQEAIHNTVKHAAAKNVTVEFIASASGFELWIIDDGVGFDPQARKEGHYGLDNMNERARQMGAEIDWQSAPNAGTKIHLRVRQLSE